MRKTAFAVRFLYGHSLSAEGVPRFRTTLRWLRNHFEFVSMKEAVRLLVEENPPSGHFLSLSFDDGFRDNYELLAPLLLQVDARACFFLISNFIECDDDYRRDLLTNRLHCPEDRLSMSWSMVRELVDAGFEVGAHTADHVNLACLPQSEAERQIGESKRSIESRLGIPCRLFAWPYGRAEDFPAGLLTAAEREFDATFSAIRSRESWSFDGRVVNRDHFEPAWPTSHVRYFLRSRRLRANGPNGVADFNRRLTQHSGLA